MKAETFDRIARARIDHCFSTLLAKGEEYSRDGDRLNNFKTAAAIDGETPEQALWGMLKKHVVSVRDMIKDIERGLMPTERMLDEKITDWIDYALLLEGLFRERMDGGLDIVAAAALMPGYVEEVDDIPLDGASIDASLRQAHGYERPCDLRALVDQRKGGVDGVNA